MIAPWIHHSRVKPASLEWECIPDPASPCRITLQNLSTFPQEDSASQETMGDQEWQDDSPALVISQSWLVYAWQKLEESILQQDKWAQCNALSPLVYICCCSSQSSLHRLCRNHPHWLDSQWQVFICSLLSLLGRMHNYSLLLLMWFPFATPEPSSCDLCICTTQTGSVVTNTLLFYTYYFCASSVMGHILTITPSI
jgi:hypothetical protein